MMENKKDGSIFLDEANKFLNRNIEALKINNELNKLFVQIIYIIRFKEIDSTEALIEIDNLITKYRSVKE